MKISQSKKENKRLYSEWNTSIFTVIIYECLNQKLYF